MEIPFEAIAETMNWEPLHKKAPLPAFHPEWLPVPIGRMAVLVADAFGIGVDAPAVFGLGALSGIAAGKIQVKPRESWIEPCTLWLCVVSPTGEGKSPVLKQMANQLFDWQYFRNEKNRKERAERKHLRQMYEKKLDKAQTEAEVKQLSAMLEALPPIALYEKFQGGNCTTESLRRILPNSDYAVSILDGEGNLLDILSGRYAENVDISTWLDGYSGGGLNWARAGEGITIPKSAISITMATQPAVMEKLLKNPMMVQKGFVGRMLIVKCDRPESRKTLLEMVPLKQEEISAYKVFMDDLLEAEKNIIEFSNEAFSLLSALEDEAYKNWPVLSDYGYIGKARGFFARTAGLLAFGNNRKQVTEEDMRKAGEIVNWFFAHLNDMISDDFIHFSPAEHSLLEWLQKHPKQYWSKGEITKALSKKRKGFNCAEDVEKAIMGLQDAGIVQTVAHDGLSGFDLFLHPEMRGSMKYERIG